MRSKAPSERSTNCSWTSSVLARQWVQLRGPQWASQGSPEPEGRTLQHKDTPSAPLHALQLRDRDPAMHQAVTTHLKTSITHYRDAARRAAPLHMLGGIFRL